MASQSKAAQEDLAALEKGSAPFEKQLIEAAKFVGVDLDILAKDDKEFERSASVVRYFAREDWLLKWLLKKLQAPADPIPRRTASSWTLLLHILRTVPIANAAKSLAEKRFISILQATLQDVKLLATELAKAETNEEPPSKKKSAKSLKRKRSGALAENRPSAEKNETIRLLEAIYAVVHYIVAASNAISAVDADEGISRAFSAEYMQTVIQTTSKEAAKILGSWMGVCTAVIPPPKGISGAKDWLLPFIEIWSSHTVDEEAHSQFSLYCTQPLLALLREVKTGQYTHLGWKSHLEQLLARNVLNLAKALKATDPESDIINNLTRASVIQDVLNAPILFEVAIRSIKPHASKRRRASDDTWLQLVFTSLKESMPESAKQHKSNGMAISAMLQLAKDYKVNLELPILRAISSEYALPEGRDGWELVAVMIKLDANVFLIADKEGETDLLKKLLTRITNASVKPTWSTLSKQVVSDVVLPLMNEFSKARDLSGFIRHWYSQLVEFERLRKASELSPESFSAWEDDALQTELAKLFEPSLTIQQIEQILDWLSAEVTKNPNVVCVLLDAVANSISGEAVIDAVGLRLYHIIFDGGAFEKPDIRYKWRSWRIISRVVDWTTYQNIDRLLGLWQKKSQPFSLLSDSFDSASFLKVQHASSGQPLERLEIFRLIASLWSAPESGNLKAILVKPVMLGLLRSLSGAIDTYFGDIQIPEGVHDNTDSSCEPKTLSRSYSWIIWSFAECCFVKYPKVLSLGLELEDGIFRAMLQSVFRLASASTDPKDFEWLRLNPNAYPSLWLSALAHDDLNTKKVTAIMIDVMLSNQTNYENFLISTPTTNDFAVQCLLRMRLENLNKKQREMILKGWLPIGDSQDAWHGLSYSNALDPALLSLKIKMMENAIFFTGMKFNLFIHLAIALEELETPRKDISLALLKELWRKTFEYIHIIPNETRNKAYILDAYKTINKKVKKAAEKSKHRLSYAFIAIFEVVLKVLLDAKTQVVEKEDLESVVRAFKCHLLDQLKDILCRSRKGDADNSQDKPLNILSTIDALSALGADASEVSGLGEDAMAFAESDKSELNVGVRLETFIFTTIYGSSTGPVNGVDIVAELTGDVKTTCGRQAIVQKTKALALGDNEQKLKLLGSIFTPGLVGLISTDKLLAARQVIISIEDKGKLEENKEVFDLSEAYAILCGQLWKTTSFVQFCIISETLELMLKTKGRSITQFNVDTTLGSIAIICSRNGPSLNSARANPIYFHLCHLFRAILHNHRLKLQGHMHLVLQTMQALLRCLFRPLIHTSKTSKFGSPPPWLSSTSKEHHLSPVAAEAFTRLVTLICDPTESSVRGKRHNKLTSATEKWKNVAGWHMQFLLMEYVSLQLEMKMDTAVREKLVPGLYAMFDTTTIEGRRLIGARLDASQRAVFGVLVKDYLRFGKWKGS